MVLKLTQELMDGLEERAIDAWSERAAKRLYAEYADHFERLLTTAPDLEPMCLEVQRWAGRYGLSGERDVLRLCLICLSLGYRFWQDPRFRPLIDRSLANEAIPTSRRVGTLAAACETWLSGLWTGDGIDGFHARLLCSIEGDEAVSVQAIYRVLPSHWDLFSNQQNQHFIEVLLKASQGVGLERDDQKLAYVACAFAYGFNWFNDPQYKHLSQIVGSATEASQLSAGMSKVFAVSEDG